MITNIQEVLQKSESRLTDLHPFVRQMTINLITQSFVVGVPIIITQGFRSIEYQNGLYAQGRTKPGQIVTNARGGRSYHNYGLAVDFALLLPDGKTASWDTLRDGDGDSQRDWFEVVNVAKKCGFEAGADWKGFVDMPHFQYTFGLSIDALEKGSKPNLKAELANKIIETELQPAWKAAHDKGDQVGMKKFASLADELRKCSNQPTKNG